MKHHLFSRLKATASRCITMTALSVAIATTAEAQFTRGIGVYPGHPHEYFGPTMLPDSTYRNLALHRAVYQTGAYDYNLTAQLLTDGVVSHSRPSTLDVLVNGNPLPARERELTINDSEWSRITVPGSRGTLEYVRDNMDIEADEIVIDGFVAYDAEAPFHGFDVTCDILRQGKTFTYTHHSDTLPGTPRRRKVVSDPNKQTGEATAMAREIRQAISLGGKRSIETLRLTFSQGNALYWSIKEVTLMRKGRPMRNLFPAQRFCSMWKAGKGDRAYVDLGTTSHISEIKLHWLDAVPSHTLEISDDARTWYPADNPGNVSTDRSGTLSTVTTSARGRYVRVTLQEAACLSELEVYGRGGMLPSPHPADVWLDDKYMLNGGDWTLCPVDCALPGKARKTGPAITATVPATVLSSYRNAGALPDPNYDDNLSMISESFFNRDFLYTRTFTVPDDMRDKRVMLNFDGINWKARVVLNGKQLGSIRGAFTRAHFDITDLLRETNTLQVYIEKNAHPGARKIKTRDFTGFNGGVLGGDNPTFHATVGWDWISTIPGRDIGIWNDVYLTANEGVTLSDPLVSTTLRQGKATMTPSVFLRNHLRTTVSGKLSGHIGDIVFEKDVTLAPLSEAEVTFSPADFPQLAGRDMELWWPNGYGEPVRHLAGFAFHANGEMPTASIHYRAGIREVTFSHRDTRLQLYINGRRFIPLGGNWGFSENHLNYRGREYDIAVDYHRQMNCNMIRNWVGQTGDEEFYEACDRHGIMVWQDFWLANPSDGPDPHDEAMFMDNARDYVRRIRRHPSIALYCGRNEGYPPESLNGRLSSLVQRLTPGALYFPSSADDGVSGHGPYRALPVREYFGNQTDKLHSERGMPNVPNVESLCRMLAPGHLWPQNEYWGKHDFTLEGAQYGSSFNELLRAHFGDEPFAMRLGTPAYKMFCTLAQWQNYEGYRAMYESANVRRQGLIIWMSHSCWPSMVWQTYDYYLEPTAAFFGIKKACEPLHVQYNEATRQVQLVNLMQPRRDISVRATVYSLEGEALWSHRTDLSIPTDSTMDCFAVEAGEAGGKTRMLRLEAMAAGDSVPVSTNTYFLWGDDPGNNLRMSAIADIRIQRANAVEPNKLVITNTGTVPALMLRLNLCAEDGEQILPVNYSDNYFHLLPGESHTVNIGWNALDARGLRPVLKVSGYNIKPREYQGLKQL